MLIIFLMLSFDVVESMNDAYGNLKSIQETFLISLEDTTMDVLNKILPDFDVEIDNFVNYINGLLDFSATTHIFRKF